MPPIPSPSNKLWILLKRLRYSEISHKQSTDSVDDYLEVNDLLDNFEEAYCGEWDSEEDFARHIVEEGYNLELEIAEYLLNKLNMKQKMMGSLANYFDY